MELDAAVMESGYTTNKRIGYSQGLIGILSKGKVDRMSYTVPAVQMALISYINKI
jgi:non-canonical (house-cleaning) NTP pyrophosphatase